MQGDIDFKDKTAVEAAGQKVFEFVEWNCKAGREEKSFTKDIETYR